MPKDPGASWDARYAEGVVAKRLDGRYLPGRRSRSWVKVKRFQRAEVVVMGWVPWRNGLSGPLAVGRWVAGDGRRAQLRFAGIVEAGFSEADRVELGRRLVDLQEPTAVPWREHRGQLVYLVRPELTVEVQHLEWTALGQGRHMSYKRQLYSQAISWTLVPRVRHWEALARLN